MEPNHFLIPLPEETRTGLMSKTQVFHEIVRTFFPKTCLCNRVFTNEFDYISRTRKQGNPKKMKLGEKISFMYMRNCPCGGTLNLNLEHPREIEIELIPLLAAGLKAGFETQVFKEGHADLRNYRIWKYMKGLSQFSSHWTPEPSGFVSLDHSFFSKDDWDEIAYSVFRDYYNNQLRKTEGINHPNERWIILGDNPDIRNVPYVHKTAIMHEPDLESLSSSFRANPEQTTALIVPAEYDPRIQDFLDWVRKHDETNTPKLELGSKLIKGYCGGKSVALIGYSYFPPIRVCEGLDWNIMLPNSDIPKTIQTTRDRKYLLAHN